VKVFGSFLQIKNKEGLLFEKRSNELLFVENRLRTVDHRATGQ
jgi:hypothetical protein